MSYSYESIDKGIDKPFEISSPEASPPMKRRKESSKQKRDTDIDITKAALLTDVINQNGNKSTTDNDSFESFARDHLIGLGNSTAILHESGNDISKMDEVDQNEVYIPLYESSKSIEGKDLDVPPKKNPKNKEVKNWQFQCEYINSEIATSAVQRENTWSILRKRDTADGVKWFYRCNKVKLRDQQCSAQLYLLFNNDSDAVKEFRTNGTHDHDSQINKAEAKQRLRTEVERLLKLHQKPNHIMQSLSEIEGLALPTKNQLINIISALKNKIYGPATISMQELEKWLVEHSAVPDSEHESFVLCYEVTFENEPYFRFMITTKYLLNLATHRSVTHSDTTYKCIWQGFPVFMVGTTDFDKAYHPYALSVCSNEKTPDFQFIFEGIKQGLLRVLGYESKQTTLVCDAAFAIINAYIETYGTNVIIIMCWFHAKVAMEDHLTLVKKANQVEILQDIEFLHIASSPEIFQNAVKLFFNKWEKEELQYCTYFRSEWIEKHPNWYVGAAEFTPCHNNALEASNRYLKESNTIRIRHSLSHFLRVASETTHKWSKRYVIGTKSFAFYPTIDTKSWTNGFQWAKSNIQAKLISQDSETMTVVIDAQIVRAKKRNDKDVVIVQSITKPEVLEILAEENKDFQNIRQSKRKTFKASQPSGNTGKGRKGKKKGETVATPVTTPAGLVVPPATAGLVVPPATGGLVVPPATDGLVVPPATDGLVVPPATALDSLAVAEFEKYKHSFFKWTVTISKKQNQLHDGRCNCPAFAKDYMCKHVVGLSIRMKYVTVPAEAKTIPCGEKRKRGRPAKNKQAWMIQ